MQPLGIADERTPAAQTFALVQRGTDRCIAAPPGELCRDNTGVVEDQAIARAQQRWQVADHMICQVALNNQHPRRIARAGRAQRNAFGGEFEIKKIDAHKVIRSP